MDRNPETLLIPDIAWVEIPGGPFIYQAGQRLELAAFRIAKYPVTNRQYQTFVDAGGYEDERWWRDLVRPEPQASRWPQPNRPKTDVDWYEAVAFCRWLSAMEGFEVRLPTEQEWEKAARGPRGGQYPWGDEYRSGFANIDEKSSKAGPWYLKQTVAVGLYPHGKSSVDVEDCSGNVWEWCLNRHDNPEVIVPDPSGSPRVLRGGSWVSGPGSARCADRGWLSPGLRASRDYGRLGFRVLSALPIR
jgi:formylglycine-generating enzyme required for sulfatase activity